MQWQAHRVREKLSDNKKNIPWSWKRIWRINLSDLKFSSQYIAWRIEEQQSMPVGRKGVDYYCRNSTTACKIPKLHLIFWWGKTVCRYFWAIHPKLPGNCTFTENDLSRKLDEIYVFYVSLNSDILSSRII